MKSLLFSVVLMFVHAVAPAQGKIGFQNDSLHLVYYGSGAGLGGQAVDSAHMPPGLTLVADLYVGTSSSAMSLITTTTFSASPGKWNQANVAIQGIPGGISVFVAAQVRDSDSGAPNTFTGVPFGNGYYGRSDIFTFTLGSSVLYPIMCGANGTWAPGTYPLDQYGAGSKGAIWVSVPPLPKPCSYPLLALGSALTIIHRRNSAAKTTRNL